MASKIGFKSACVLGLVSGLILGGCVIVVDGKSDEWSDSFESTSRPRIGVDIAEPGRTLASQLNIDRKDATVITEVRSESPADRAGLKRYDVVTAIDGLPKADPDDLRRAVRSKEWGDTITLTIIRAGQPIDVTIPLERSTGKPAGYPS
jgi:S1-C subfamily serine protease